MHATMLFSLAALAATAFSAPLDTRADTFDDGFGKIPNDMFSIIMTPQLKSISITAAGHADRDFLPKHPAFVTTLPCTKANIAGIKGDSNGQDYDYYKPDWMPYGVSIHGGGLCTAGMLTSDKDAFDGLWVKYANQYLNTPTDTRCGHTNSGGSMRCILPLHP